ncbi:MAG: hypothetical protein QOI31_2351 [Solirubrobacterales bacterium]|nr:hypothetical protein [Solirubrobacterales bacterium]
MVLIVPGHTRHLEIWQPNCASVAEAVTGPWARRTNEDDIMASGRKRVPKSGYRELIVRVSPIELEQGDAQR